MPSRCKIQAADRRNKTNYTGMVNIVGAWTWTFKQHLYHVVIIMCVFISSWSVFWNKIHSTQTWYICGLYTLKFFRVFLHYTRVMMKFIKKHSELKKKIWYSNVQKNMDSFIIFLKLKMEEGPSFRSSVSEW